MKPLHGIRVVDFGCYLAGPLVGRHLADAGASVISIQPPNGPLWKHKHVNHALSRGKTTISVDLKSKAGKKQAWEHILSADGLIENFTPGVMDRLGFSSEKVRRANPNCIYLSLPGFASNDMEFRDVRAFEAIIMAQSGVYCDMGLNRTLMGINPSYSPLPLASTYGSVIGAVGVVLALIGRDGKGMQGDTLQVPLGAALCDALVFNSLDIPSLPPRYFTMRELEIAKKREKNEAMNMNYRQIKALLDPFYHTYICGDGRPFYVVAPCHVGHQVRCLKALNIWDDMIAHGLDPQEQNVYAESNEWKENYVLGTYPLTDPIWIVRFKNAMKKAFLKRSAIEWEKIFAGSKITGCATKTTTEWLRSEHALSSGLVVERPSPHLSGMMREGGPLVWHQASKNISLRSQKHRNHVRNHAKASLMSATNKNTSSTNNNNELWLSGTNVLDLSNVIAGPTIGGMLARYGADVLKIDPTKPTYDALVAVYMGVPINTGKRSGLVNIKKHRGRSILKELVKWADVVIVNQIESQLTALGVDDESVKKMNSKVILMHFDAFGGPKFGSRSNSVGYDDLCQASTGIMARFGGSLKTPAEHAHLGTVDVVSGFSGCLATVLSLYKRLKTGVSDVARTSLAANAQLIQTPFMYDYDGKDPNIEEKEPRGPLAAGEHYLYRWYKTK